MALSKIQPASMDLTANYAFTGTNSISGVEYAEKKLATLTASSSGTLNFTSSIDNTYNIYKFRFINMHGSQSSDAQWSFQGSTDSGSNYNTAMVTTVFRAYHFENDAGAALQSRSADNEEGQSGETAYQPLGYQGGAVADENCSGELFLFNPSSTTFMKHFISRNAAQGYDSGNGGFQQDYHVAGHFNTTSAIDAISFKFSTGNIDSGTIEMYGIN